jgi:hypothetical protein
VANFRYFQGERELSRVTYSNGKPFGLPEGVEAKFTQEHGWMTGFVQAERVIEYKSNPSRHECDARCMNASGRTMNCECSCGGKNHGRGAFNCEPC